MRGMPLFVVVVVVFVVESSGEQIGETSVRSWTRAPRIRLFVEGRVGAFPVSLLGRPGLNKLPEAYLPFILTTAVEAAAAQSDTAARSDRSLSDVESGVFAGTINTNEEIEPYEAG